MKSKSKSTIKLMIDQMTPVYENLLNRVAEDYELDAEELKKKYLSDFKTFKKKKKNKPSAYGVFLSDKNILLQLKNEYPEATFGQLSKYRGEIWKKMSEIDKNAYQNIATQKLHDQEQEQEQEVVSEEVVSEEVVSEEVVSEEV